MTVNDQATPEEIRNNLLEDLKHLRSEDILALLRPSLRIVGRTFSGQTYSITGTNKKRYTFLREGKTMVLRFSSWDEFSAEQEALIRGVRRDAKIVTDITVDLNGMAETPKQEEQPKQEDAPYYQAPADENDEGEDEDSEESDPVQDQRDYERELEAERAGILNRSEDSDAESQPQPANTPEQVVNTDEPVVNTHDTPEPPVEPEPKEESKELKEWREKRAARQRKLNNTGNKKLQGIIEKRGIDNIPLKSPRPALIEAILNDECGTEENPKGITLDEESEPSEQHQSGPAEPSDEAASKFAGTSRWNAKELNEMPLDGEDGLRALGAKHGFSGTRKEIIAGLMGSYGG